MLAALDVGLNGARFFLVPSLTGGGHCLHLFALCVEAPKGHIFDVHAVGLFLGLLCVPSREVK